MGAEHVVVVRPGDGRRVGNVEFLARSADTPRFNLAIITIQPHRPARRRTGTRSRTTPSTSSRVSSSSRPTARRSSPGRGRSCSCRRASSTRSRTAATRSRDSSTSTRRPASTSVSKPTDRREGQTRPVAELDNAAVAERLDAFAGLLDLAGGSGYSSRAYRRAAETIRATEAPILQLARQGRAQRAPRHRARHRRPAAGARRDGDDRRARRAASGGPARARRARTPARALTQAHGRDRARARRPDARRLPPRRRRGAAP